MIDLKRRNICMNTLVPEPTATPGLVGLAGPDEANQRGLLDQMALGVPMARVGDPDEIAQAALFLASDESSFVTGSELFVDGGRPYMTSVRHWRRSAEQYVPPFEIIVTEPQQSKTLDCAT